MLQISLRENQMENAKRKYFFRSSNNGTLSIDQLVSEMASFNTTITEADTLGVLNVMKQLVMKYVNLGYTVHTPLGYFHASASGSTNDLLEQFTPASKLTNHTVALLYCPTPDVNETMKTNMQMERVSNRPIMTPSIDSVQNAAGDHTASIKAGDTIQILGDYLKFNEKDSSQGIFVTVDGTETRLTYYCHNTNSRLEARIPADMAAGTYTVKVRNIPSTVPSTTTWKKQIIITA